MNESPVPENGGSPSVLPKSEAKLLPAPTSLVIAEVIPEPTASDSEKFATITAAGFAVLPQPNLGWSVLLAILPLVAQIFTGLAVMAVGAAGYVLLTGRSDELSDFLERMQVVLFPVGSLTTVAVAMAVSLAFYRRDALRIVAMRWCSRPQFLLTLLYIMPLGIVADELTNYVADLFASFEFSWWSEFRKTEMEAFKVFSQQPFWLVFLAGCVMPGVGEELLCRGVMSHGLIARYGPFIGGFLTSFLFGAMHVEPIHAFGAFVLGVGLQLVFSTTKSLPAAIIVHLLNNAFAFLLLRYQETISVEGLSELPSDTPAHTPAPLLFAAVASLACLTWLLYRTRTRWRLPDGTDWNPGHVTSEKPPTSLNAQAVHEAPSLGHWIVAGITYAALLATFALAALSQS